MQTNAHTAMSNVVPINAPPESLLDEYVQNKAEADKLTARNQEIARQLATMAHYKHGSNTGHVASSKYKATVTLRENVKFNQDLLEEARTAVGNQCFFELFAPKFEPRGGLGILKKKLPDMEMPDRVRIERAVIVTTGQPQLKVEEIQ